VEAVTFKYSQGIQQTGTGSKETADVVIRSCETAVNEFVNALDVGTCWCRVLCLVVVVCVIGNDLVSLGTVLVEVVLGSSKLDM